VSHTIVVNWSESAFPTSQEAENVTRMSLTDAAKALGVNEPNVTMKDRAGEVDAPTPTTDVPAAEANERGTVVDDSFAEGADAQEWAQVFIKRFAGATVQGGEVGSQTGLGPVDEGLMIGWFANAMAAGERKANSNAQAKAEALLENPS